MGKPANLVYGAEEVPPSSVTWISAIQHVGLIAIAMIYPLIIGREAGASADQLSNMLRMGMVALAIAALLQALPRGPPSAAGCWRPRFLTACISRRRSMRCGSAACRWSGG